MTQRNGTKMRGMGATLGVFAVVSFGAMTAARPASAQDIERVLAGIRLNTKSSNVLAKYGNPNEVVIGDIGVRGIGPSGAAGGSGTGGQGVVPGEGGAPGGGGLPALGGGGKRGPTAAGMSSAGGGGAPPAGPPGGFGGPPGGFGGPPGGFGSPPGGGGFGAPPGDEGGGGFPGSGGAGTGSTSGAVGPFGQSVSTLAREQEVTWIYNRKVNNNLVTYNFLIGPNGNVVQILVTGYNGGNSKTKRGIGLGSTYKDVVKVYGYPEEHAIVGRTLIASYRTKAHASFQFQLQTPQDKPLASGNKVIGITIATVE